MTQWVQAANSDQPSEGCGLNVSSVSKLVVLFGSVLSVNLWYALIRIRSTFLQVRVHFPELPTSHYLSHTFWFPRPPLHHSAMQAHIYSQFWGHGAGGQKQKKTKSNGFAPPSWNHSFSDLRGSFSSLNILCACSLHCHCYCCHCCHHRTA